MIEDNKNPFYYTYPSTSQILLQFIISDNKISCGPVDDNILGLKFSGIVWNTFIEIEYERIIDDVRIIMCKGM